MGANSALQLEPEGKLPQEGLAERIVLVCWRRGDYGRGRKVGAVSGLDPLYIREG